MIEIVHRDTRAVLYRAESPDFETAVVAAVHARAVLRGADLRGADLRDADLRGWALMVTEPEKP